MFYRLLAGIAAMCVTVLVGIARADLFVPDYDIYYGTGPSQKANTDTIRAVAASPDGTTLVCAGRGGFYLYSAETDKRLEGLPEETDYATGILFAPDGKTLFTADAAGRLLRWDFASRKITFRFPHVHSTIEQIALSADGSTLASTDGSFTVFWDTRSGKLLNAWNPPTNRFNDYFYYRRSRYIVEGEDAPQPPRPTSRFHLALSPDGRTSATGQTSRPFQLRDIDKDSAAQDWAIGVLNSIDFAPDGKSYALAVRSGAIEIVAAKSFDLIRRCKSPSASAFVRFAPDGKTLVSFHPDIGVLAALDVADGTMRWQHQQAPAWRTTAIAFAGPGRLATADSDRRLRVYDLRDGRLVKTIDLPSNPRPPDARPNEAPAERAYTIDDFPSLLSLSRQSNGKPIASPHIRHRLGAAHLWHSSPIIAGTFLKDGKELLVIPGGAVPIVFDTETGNPIRTLDQFHARLGETNGFEQITFSADRRRLFATSGRKVFVWDLDRQRIEHEYDFPTRIMALAVARDGKRFAVAGFADMLCPQPIFVGSTDSPAIQSLQGHEHTVTYLAFSLDGNRLFSANQPLVHQTGNAVIKAPGLVIEWELANGKRVRSHTHDAYKFVCTPDSRIWSLQDGNQACELFDWQTQKSVGKVETLADTIAFTPDGAALVTGGNQQRVQLWDARTGKLLRKFREPIEQGTAIVCLSGDSTLLATQEMAKNGGTVAGNIRLWNLKSGEEVCLNPGPRGPIEIVAYSPDGRLIVSLGEDRRILWWDAKTGKRIDVSSAADPSSKVSAQHPLVQLLSFSADGSTLAATTGSQSIFVWDVATRKLIGKVALDTADLKNLALSADGKRLITVRPNGIVRTWNVAGGKMHGTFTLWPSDPDDRAPLQHSAFSPDATQLAACPPRGTEILVFDVQQGKMVRCLPFAPPRDPETYTRESCMALAFSGDGRYLAGSVQTNPIMYRRWGPQEPARSTIHVWELASGTKSTSIRDLVGGINTLVFAPDGRSLLHGISDSSVRWSGYSKGGFYEIGGFSNAESGAVVRDLSAGHELKQFMGTGPAFVCMTTGYELPIVQGVMPNSSCLAFAPDKSALVTCDRDRTLLNWDARPFLPGKLAVVALSEEEQEAAWAELTVHDGKIAYAAIERLTRDPKGTLEFLKNRLAAQVLPDAGRLQELIRQLGSDSFLARMNAQRELERHGDLAEPAIRLALVSERDPQRSRCLEGLLARLADDFRPERMRERRAVEVLERIGARARLQELAAGPGHAKLTREASAALARCAAQ